MEYLKKPKAYAKKGIPAPKGVMLYGPPGTGKTLMAKAIAKEANVPFFSVSGSDFVQLYVGVGASRVRELFKEANKYEKAVIFIDEIDAIGKKRGQNAFQGNDEKDQTLNALLTEMSGFKGKEGIVVIAATNRLDTLESLENLIVSLLYNVYFYQKRKLRASEHLNYMISGYYLKVTFLTTNKP